MRSSRRSSRSLLGLLAVLGLLLAVAGCSGGTGGGVGLTVTDAWVRPPQTTDGAAAAYLVIKNAGSVDDALIGVSSATAGMASIHETSMETGGMMGMHPIAKVDVPVGATVTFEPGGYHIMLEGLTREISPGMKIELTLTFEKAGKIEVSAEVRAS
jgi:copper(I)-binding protein